MKKKIFILFYFVIFFSSVIAKETFVSLKKGKVNVRYGPSFESDIKYVYKKTNLPLKQIDKKENFKSWTKFKWIYFNYRFFEFKF